MADPWHQIHTIFNNALDCASDEERQRYLDQACGEAPNVRERVAALLKAHFDSRNEFDDRAAGMLPIGEQPGWERAGTRIGHYHLVEQLGEGGMGVVFQAEQTEPVKRQVALKIIKPGMDTRRVIELFEAERQALALMDHPNVAKVYDAGTAPSGRPYFVMEVVDGVSITSYCDLRGLTIRQRLELFIVVCQAVQHAHQKGIIHRDLKPSNILVSECDGRAVPKVIDFGVAKAIDQGTLEKTTFTSDGQIVGTPEYMSPEQARSSTLVDTRSDVYSLGVVLYELLTSDTPLDRQRLRSAAWDDVMRMIQDEEPPTPSKKLSSSDKLSTVAAHRQIEPARLSGLVRGELDWIVMKALDKERARRYQTASELAQDIERYLHDRPVEAGPPSAGYRLRKFACRNKRILATFGLLVLVLITGTAISLYQAVRATRAENLAGSRLEEVAQERDAARRAQAQAQQERESAERARQISQTVTQYLVQAFRSPNPERDGRAITVAEILDRAADELQDRFADQPLVKAHLLFALGQSYEGLGLYHKAVRLCEDALEVCQRELGRAHEQTLSMASAVANGYVHLGRFEEAVALHEQTLELMNSVLGPQHPHTLTGMSNLAVAYLANGRAREAVTLHEQSLELKRLTLGPDDPRTLKGMNELAATYVDIGRLDEAVTLQEQTLELQTEILGAVHPDTLHSMHNLAEKYRMAGRVEDALRIQRRLVELRESTLGTDHPDTLNSMNSLSVSLSALGRWDEAVALVERVLEARKASLGVAHPSTLTSMSNLATAFSKLGRLDEALQLREQVVKAFEATLGPAHPDTLASIGGLATSYQDCGRLSDAVALYEQTLESLKATRGPEHRATLEIMDNLATSYHDIGRTDEALELAEQVMKIRTTTMGPVHPDTLTSMHNLATKWCLAGRVEEALALHEQTLRMRTEHLGDEHPDTIVSMASCAGAYREAERPDDAAALLERALRLWKARMGDEHPITLSMTANLAVMYAEAGRREEAIAMHEQTLELCRAKLGADHPGTLVTMYNLAASYREVNQLDRALALFQEAVDRQRTLTGPLHDQTLRALHELAITHARVEHLEQAAELLDEATRGRREVLGDEHPDTLDSLMELGTIHQQLGDYAQAESLLLEAYHAYVQRSKADGTPGDRQRTEQIIMRLIELYEATDQPEQVREWREKTHDQP